MRTHLFASLALGASLTACLERDPSYDAPLVVLQPVSVGGSLFYTDTALHRAYVLDLQNPEAGARTHRVGSDPVVVTPRVGGTAMQPRTEALVLSRGVQGSTGVLPEPGTLTVIPAREGSARRYTVGSDFNGLAQTSDGRYAFTYFLPSTRSGRLLFNPNEIALVDLDAPPSANNPRVRTVRSFGGVPNAVVFSPPMMVNARRRTLAAVLSDAYVTLIDIDNPDRAEITVRLTLPEDPRAIRPTQVLFDTEEATLYVRAEASNDIYVLRLAPATPDGPTANDFRPSINQLAAGRSPSDMALIGETGARRLLVVSPGSRDARVIDARANTTLTIPLEAPSNKILLFTSAAPRDPMLRSRALLYGTDGSTSAVSFLELTDLDARRAQNVETLQLNRPLRSALPLTDRGVVMFGHVGGFGESSPGQRSLLDLTRRTAAPILAQVSLDGARFDDDRSTLWVAPRGGERIGFIDLRSFRPGELRLDGPVTDVVPVVGDRDGRRRVVVVHSAAGGWITVLDGNSPLRETARSIRGFLLTGLLDDQGEQ